MATKIYLCIYNLLTNQTEGEEVYDDPDRAYERWTMYETECRARGTLAGWQPYQGDVPFEWPKEPDHPGTEEAQAVIINDPLSIESLEEVPSA